jgi:hypothetical protein
MEAITFFDVFGGPRIPSILFNVAFSLDPIDLLSVSQPKIGWIKKLADVPFSVFFTLCSSSHHQLNRIEKSEISATAVLSLE